MVSQVRGTVCGDSRCGFPCLDNEELTLYQGMLLGHSTATHHGGSNNSGKCKVIHVCSNEIITLEYLDYGRQLKVEVLSMTLGMNHMDGGNHTSHFKV